jgi:superfamily II DNA/RNA helicase
MLPETEDWGGIPVPKSMVDNLRAREIVAPTPVQAAALAELCTGRHAMVAAPTGTGKTLAFLVPLLVRMQATKKLGPLRGLVVLPTRELALQVSLCLFCVHAALPWFICFQIFLHICLFVCVCASASQAWKRS